LKTDAGIEGIYRGQSSYRQGRSGELLTSSPRDGSRRL
jgi:hypothetical protein